MYEENHSFDKLLRPLRLFYFLEKLTHPEYQYSQIAV